MEVEAQVSRGPSWLRRALVGRNPKITMVRLVLLILGCLVLFNFVLLPSRIQGPSMLPTYGERGVNFVSLLAYTFHEPQRGDIVAIRTTGIHVMYMKRIIALPGETIAFHHGHVLINGKLLYDPYVKFACDWEIPACSLSSNEYFVCGDNRSKPETDHEKGIANRNKIAGKVLL